jgi:hypothetical protein
MEDKVEELDQSDKDKEKNTKKMHKKNKPMDHG